MLQQWRFITLLCAFILCVAGCGDKKPPANETVPAPGEPVPVAPGPVADARDTASVVLAGDGAPTGYPDSFFGKIPIGRQLLPGFYEVYLNMPDSKIKVQPAYAMIYQPKEQWKDTLNTLVVHRDSTDTSPVVALLGVRRNGNAWQRVYVTRSPRVLGALQRVSNDEWALAVDDHFDSWAHVPYGYTKSGTMRGWVRVDPPRVVIREPEGPPRDDAPSSVAIIARYRALIPDSALVRRKACPFECCTYRDWKATHEIPVYRNEMDSGAPIFTLRTGESFHALTGNVHITGVAVVAVNKKIQGDTPQHTLLPGDSVVILNSVGEGNFNVWKKNGQIVEVNGDWSGPPWKPNTNHRLGNYRTQWWVQVRTFDVRDGWIHADTARFTNADRCG